MSTPRLAVLLLIALLVAPLGQIPSASAQITNSPKPGYPAEEDLIEIQFAPESRVRLRSGALVDLSTNALAGVDGVLSGSGRPEWSRISEVPEQTLDDIQARGMAVLGREILNMNNIYRLRVETDDVWTLSAQLEALPGVLTARPVPKPMALPLPPNFQPTQNYEDPAFANPTGVDAEFAWTQPGGSGTGVTVCDLEYSWNYSHNDVTKAFNSQLNTNVADPFLNTDHGTAVVGELVSNSLPNWGTKGVCFSSNLKTCGTYYGTTPSWNVAGAMAVAIAALNPGDVILLEQQWAYSGAAGYVPIEWWTDVSPGPQTPNPVYVAITNAIAAGIHVVQAGGNGGVDTDTMDWYYDSGAIIVGAGGAYFGGGWPEGNLERLSFSSYGARFNLQGWGEDVVTTGYGDLFNVEGVNRWYTSQFSGTSSASPIVAGAVACIQGYYQANISPTPLSAISMRTLLMETGTPQAFGPFGNIGPRPDCFAAIQRLQPQLTLYEYGDAPEGAFAYPQTGVIGRYPTCLNSGLPGTFVRHAQASPPMTFFGPSIDYEPEGNAGNCPNFPPYDADECWNDGDAGLIRPPSYTIDPNLNIVPCDPSQTDCLGQVCTMAQWGPNVDINVTNNQPAPMFVNVLMDWNQDGVWGGTSNCNVGPAPEHVLVNFIVPGGFSGPLSLLVPPGFLIGPNYGHVWTRFTIDEQPVPFNWDGSGDFFVGESCDYLLCVEHGALEYGDAPEGATAYPWLGVIGQFPTCTMTGPAGFVRHASTGSLFFGPTVDLEADGNAGNCPNFPPYDADECQNDGDAGLMNPAVYTIDPFINVVPCPTSSGPISLGTTCGLAVWGPNVDIQVTNFTAARTYVNVLIDWNQNGSWAGSSLCPQGATPEHVLVNFPVPSGFNGPISLLVPPAFRIGPNEEYVWCRFTVSEIPVALGWDGSGSFQDGESCDYLLHVARSPMEYGDAPEGATAYPWLGVIGQFPTCTTVGPAGFVRHASTGALRFGPSVDLELDGNAGNCPFFPPYDRDECQSDGDAGLLIPRAFSIDGSLNIVICAPGPGPTALGQTCAMASWGSNINIQVRNVTAATAYVNVLMDWDHSGTWAGSSVCAGGAAPEHILVNFPVPAGFNGLLSTLAPPAFRIGPNDRHVWTRFTVSEAPVVANWDGSGNFADGETCDYLLNITSSATGIDESFGSAAPTRLLGGSPNPFHGETSIRFELDRAGKVNVDIYDVAGRRVRTLVDESRAVGSYAIPWDGRDESGQPVAAGMYFVQMRTEGTSQTARITHVR